VLDALILAEQEGVALRTDGTAARFATIDDEHRASPELKTALRQCRHTLAGMLSKNHERESRSENP
jgi:hypothetical protein